MDSFLDLQKVRQRKAIYKVTIANAMPNNSKSYILSEFSSEKKLSHY